MRTNKLIPVFAVMLLLVSSVFAFTDYTLLKKECVHSGGTWILEPCPVGEICPINEGHCEYPPKPRPPVNNRGNRNHWTDKTCNFDKKDTCRFRFKINQLAGFQHNEEDYTLDYVKYTKGAWHRNIWKFWRQSNPVISITDENGNSVYYGTPEEGEVLFDNLELTDFDFAGYFVWMTVKKVE